ncbi:MAG: HEAT repeat domain-containing protein [Planctomycetota bacterium]
MNLAVRSLGSALLALGALATGGAAEETTAELEWRSTERRQYASRRLSLAPQPPPGVKAPPGATHYLRQPLAARHLLLGTDLTRLWVDRDFDGDLGDEEPIPLHRQRYLATGTVTLLGVDLHFHTYVRDRRPHLYLTVVAHRAGTVVLAGRVRPLALYDRDGDLRFDGPDDRFLLDLDGDGRLDRRDDSAERIVPGEPFRLRDHGYVAELVGPSAPRVLFRRVAEAPRPPPRDWTRLPTPPAGVAAHPPEVALATLKARHKSARSAGKKTPAASTRRQADALRAIGNVGSREAFDYLHRVYTSTADVRLKAVAVRAMGYRDHVEQAARVIKIARHAKAADVRIAAMESLHRMGAPERAAPYAEILRRTADERECAAAARHLAWTQTEEGGRVLDEAVFKLPKLKHRYHAYFAATRYRTRAPPRALVVGAARALDPRLRNLALRDARRLGLPETRLLALECARAPQTDPELQLAVTEILAARADPEAVGALLPLADGAPPTLRGRLIDLLRPVRDEAAVEALLAGLRWRSPEVRALVAEVVWTMPQRQVVDAVTARLADERQEPALTALIRAAGHLRAAGAVAAIAEAARRDPENAPLQATALRALGRIGLSHGVVLAFFAERAHSARWEERVVVLDAAAESGDPGAVDVILPHLGDDVWQVRLAAVQGLGRLRVKRSIPPLIARLAEEEMARIKRALGDALYKLTGKSFFDLADIWARWWREHGEEFTVPPEAPAGGVPHGGRRTFATFYGVPVESDRVIFVIDQSGSMGQGQRGREGKTELEKAVDETLQVAAKLPPGARINVILFESVVTRWKKGLVKLTRFARGGLKAYLRRKRAHGATNLYDALEMALLSEGVDTIYLLSDGHPNEGRFVRHEEIVRAVRRLNQTRRITLHCVALGYDSGLLRQLAASSGGTYLQR